MLFSSLNELYTWRNLYAKVSWLRKVWGISLRYTSQVNTSYAEQTYKVDENINTYPRKGAD